MQEAEYFIEKADQCFRLAQVAKQPGHTGTELASNLEELGNEFWAKAVEIQAHRKEANRKN